MEIGGEKRIEVERRVERCIEVYIAVYRCI